MSIASADILQENIGLRERNAELELEVKELLAKLRFISGQRFATSQSEKMAPLQGSLFDEAEATAEDSSLEPQDDVDVGSHKRKKTKRKPLPDHLPRQVHEHDLVDGERLCAEGHGVMQRTGSAVNEQLEYQPARYLVHRHECATYSCLVCDAKKTAVSTFPQPLPGSMATPSLLAHIIVSKYQDHCVPRTCRLGRTYGADREMRDRPLAVGDQESAANHCMLLPLRAVVVSDAGKAEQYSVLVRFEETSESKLSMKRRNSIDDVKTESGGHLGISTSGVLKTGSCGIRLEGSVNSKQALGRNVGTCRRNAKRKNQAGGPSKDRSTDVRHRDRATRSSDEEAVMALERRGSGISLTFVANRSTGGAA